jgi:hypothetical protein
MACFTSSSYMPGAFPPDQQSPPSDPLHEKTTMLPKSSTCKALIPHPTLHSASSSRVRAEAMPFVPGSASHDGVQYPRTSFSPSFLRQVPPEPINIPYPRISSPHPYDIFEPRVPALTSPLTLDTAEFAALLGGQPVRERSVEMGKEGDLAAETSKERYTQIKCTEYSQADICSMSENRKPPRFRWRSHPTLSSNSKLENAAMADKDTSWAHDQSGTTGIIKSYQPYCLR